MAADACQSYTAGSGICADGFPQNSACRGSRCHCCGTWAADRKPPACMNEELDGRFIDETGAPILTSRRKEPHHDR